MNRIIKFRAQRLDNRKWVYGDLEYIPGKQLARIHSYDTKGNYEGQHIVIPETVCQFTGLLDRNGKEIVSLKKKISEQCARCRSCKYFGHGFATGGGNYTAVCKARPKNVKYHAFNVPPGEVYYATLAINKACDKYEPKTQDKGINDSSEFS